MTWQELVDRIRTAGRYDSDAEAERVLRAVLTVLGGQVVGDERCELVRALPAEAGALLAAQVPVTEPVTAPGFVDRVARALAPLTDAEARWAASTVLTVVADTAGDPLTRRILAGLPRGYALLFGLAELAPAA
ncbi:DUF2267 domain-containing protein [Streptomyces somaliensis DSM 40738]|uniref:DUF2267 domain-containing protein n=1 Tax=Streptomyces somaliensis (strain ATCC 33201 / DSM 40738 / JCM 12659 / KCTC 9044 / NCTC 11332 / NRRL B-12077 / IP 733) TaxID=1134445 RepID=A0AA44DHF1_STRE0|nr:DUF2267 domain-containing protein [Streptomyces somaliensis]MCQ0021640.1 DUF2267 domain-containing protein [Streptomyces somaliensis DSM 40738]NKY16560.1 DUF2267 domain-containing protein [Streptomyces somaliensis DSM 40738]